VNIAQTHMLVVLAQLDMLFEQQLQALKIITKPKSWKM
jgi:hypothetical protein